RPAASANSGSAPPLFGPSGSSVQPLPTESTDKSDKAPTAEKSAVVPASGSSSGDEPRNAAASAPLPPGSGENSLYRISTDGTVRELFRDKIMVLSLLRQNGRLLVGTGMHGQLFEINETTKEKSEIARLDHGQIHCLLLRRDGTIILGTGDPGKLYVLENKFTAKGTITSDVLDAKIISKWGALTWKAETPAGPSVTFGVRTGNVAEPDA